MVFATEWQRINDLLQEDHPEIPGEIGVGQITCGIVLIITYWQFHIHILVAQWLGRRTSDPAVSGSIPHPRVFRHLGQLSLPYLRGR